MKYLIIILFILTSFLLKAQSPQTVYEVTSIISMQAYSGKAERIFVHDVNRDYILCSPCTVDGVSIYSGAAGRKWRALSTDTTSISRRIDSASVKVVGGVIGHIPIVGENFGSNLTPTQWITAAFFVTPPLATLTLSEALELTSASTISRTLNYTASRQSATAPIATIVVAGVNKTFTQPAQPGTVSGTQAVVVPTNTTTTYTNLVTTTDSKTASASVSFTFSPKRYWFYSSTTAPTSSDVVAALGGSSELTSLKAKLTAFSVVVTGTTKYVSYAYPSSFGSLTSINISGLESIGAFNLTVVSVTNASGYVQNYNVYTSTNSFNNVTINFISVQ